jgi:hypothetical protein
MGLRRFAVTPRFSWWPLPELNWGHEEEVASLLKRTRSAALEGKYELYKTSTRFDGTQRHPEWLGEDPLAG